MVKSELSGNGTGVGVGVGGIGVAVGGIGVAVGGIGVAVGTSTFPHIPPHASILILIFTEN